MSDIKVWELTDSNLPESLNHVKAIFLSKELSPASGQEVDKKPTPPVLHVSDRARGEGLHDYLTRKNIKCWCRKCRDGLKQQALENNLSLI